MANNSFGYGFYSENIDKPSILTASGPYDSIEEAISSILSEYQNISPITGAPPLGHKFGVKTNGTYTWYTYKSGNFNLENVGIGIVPEGSGGGITNVVKGKSTDNEPPTLVTGTVAYIPMAKPQVNGQGGTDGLMSASDKSKLDYLIEVLEPGIYNSDASFEVQGQSSADVTVLQGQVNRIINILGSLYDINGLNDAHFEIE